MALRNQFTQLWAWKTHTFLYVTILLKFICLAHKSRMPYLTSLKAISVNATLPRFSSLCICLIHFIISINLHIFISNLEHSSLNNLITIFLHLVTIRYNYKHLITISSRLIVWNCHNENLTKFRLNSSTYLVSITYSVIIYLVPYWVKKLLKCKGRCSRG